jgi:hypothetical protein
MRTEVLSSGDQDRRFLLAEPCPWAGEPADPPSSHRSPVRVCPCCPRSPGSRSPPSLRLALGRTSKEINATTEIWQATGASA